MRAVPSGYDERAFSNDVVSKWGHLSQELSTNQGQLHSQMAHLSRLCKARPDLAQDVFRFLDDVLNRPDAVSEIENAIAISFLDWTDIEKLGFKRSEIPFRLAATLRRQWKLDND